MNYSWQVNAQAGDKTLSSSPMQPTDSIRYQAAYILVRGSINDKHLDTHRGNRTCDIQPAEWVRHTQIS